MKINNLILILSATMALAGCNNGGSSGSSGNTGKEPESGEAILHGKGAPSNSLGENYSHYYDEDTRLVWEKNDGVWYNKFTKASSALYSVPNGNAKKAADENNDRNVLINALATSFYTTNGTVDVECTQDGSDYVWGYTAAFAKQNICLTPHWSVDPKDDVPEYYKIDEEGKLYSKNESGSYDLVDNDNVYCTVPHATVETIIYDNFLMYDDNYGYLTGIIAGNLDKFSYDGTKSVYSATGIKVTHGPITSYYVHEPASDEMKINYTFKLSSDSSYVETAEFTITEAIETAGYVGMHTKFSFSKIHNTVVE